MREKQPRVARTLGSAENVVLRKRNEQLKRRSEKNVGAPGWHSRGMTGKRVSAVKSDKLKKRSYCRANSGMNFDN